ncbi:transmembrane protein 170A-like [Haliotis asinina]|uniref:transmembrane protein 170A-like n=1 Tax=Haliotis asinina TaxID=109174 RepID=UPI00353254AE
MTATKDFQMDELDSILNVLWLSANDDLDSFGEMWYQIFLWALFSSMLVHVIASLIAVCRLRKHKLGRWIPVVIVAMGVLSPLTGGVVTSAVIAGVFRASDFVITPFYALVCGVGQTIIVMFISFTRILATL